MKNPQRVCPLSSWLHRPPVVGEDGVYCEAVSRFPWVSLVFVDPFGRACCCCVISALLLLLFLCVYVGVPAGAWLLFVRTASSFPSFFSPSMHIIVPPSTQSPRQTPPAGLSRADDQWRQGGTSIKTSSFGPLRSLIRERLSSFPPTSALGRCSLLFGLLELFIFSLLLRLFFLHLFRVAAGFSHSQLEEYSRCLAAAHESRRQDGFFSASASPTPSKKKEVQGQGTAQIKGNAKTLRAATKHLLEGQVAVVTGVTSGTGRETALQLANWGARVYFGARSMERGRSVAAALNAEVAAAAAAPASSSPISSSCCSEHPLQQHFLHRVSSLCDQLIRSTFSSPNTAPTTNTNFQTQGQDSYIPRVHVYELDLCRAASVREFARWVLAETNGQVDILVNNAGHMYLPDPTPVTFDEGACFEYHIVCNHMGHFLLTQLLLPALNCAAASAANQAALGRDFMSFEAGRGRIVTLSSCVHALHSPGFSVLDAAFTPETAREAAAAIASGEIAERQHQSQQSEKEDKWIAESLLQGRRQPTAKKYNPWSAYSNSKLCNIWFTKELQRQLLGSAPASWRELEQTDSRTCKAPENTVNGGARRNPEEQSRKLDSCVGVYAVHPGVVDTALWRDATKHSLLAYVTNWLTSSLFMKTPADGAATSLFLCIAPKCMLQWGGFYADGNPTWVVPAALDKKAQQELWVVSKNVCRSSGAGSVRSVAQKQQLAAKVP